MLLASGASTDDVEVAMRRVGRASGLLDVQSAVLMGILAMSALRPSDRQPLTQLRIVGKRVSDYHRLAAVGATVDDIERGTLALVDAPAELDRIERLPFPYRAILVTIASALSSAAATLLFGGSLADATATLLITLGVAPVTRRVERSGLPDFFRALLGPLLATLAVVLLVAVHAPIDDAGLVVTGAILRYLPGAAIVAGMRDLIDRSIISGSARLAEAILLGSAVAVGTAIAINLGTALGEGQLVVGVLRVSELTILVQAIAAGFSCAFFALTLGVRPRVLASVFLLGAAAWATTLAAERLGSGEIVPIVVAAVGVGAIGEWLASRVRLPSVLWTVPAILPLLPGLTIVRGILGIQTTNGLLTMVSAIGIGFALGAGVAFGSILVAFARRARDVAQDMVLSGLEEVRFENLRQLRVGGQRPAAVTPLDDKAETEDAPPSH
jgi:uncharacterized membrane protein YjjP (DUF1212 family)